MENKHKNLLPCGRGRGRHAWACRAGVSASIKHAVNQQPQQQQQRKKEPPKPSKELIPTSRIGADPFDTEHRLETSQGAGESRETNTESRTC